MKSKKRIQFIFSIAAMAFLIPFGDSSPPPITLAFYPQSGQTLLYGLNCRMNSDGKGFFGKSLSLGLSVEGEINLSIESANQNSVTAGLLIPCIRFNFKSPLKNSSYILSVAEEDSVGAVFKKSGRLRDISNMERVEAKNPMNIPFLELFKICLPSLPSQKVSPGDSWKDVKWLSIPFQQINLETRIEIKYTLKDVYPSGHDRDAFVSVDFVVSQSGTKKWESITGSLYGKGTGTGFLIFHVDKGYVSEYRLDYSLNGMMTATAGDIKLMEQPFNSAFSISLNSLGALLHESKTMHLFF